MKKVIIGVLIALAVLSGVLIAKKKLSKKRYIPLKTFTVKRGEVKNLVEATGIMEPQVGAKVKVGARISGTVIEEKVKVGDRVKKGQLIAVIDNRELRQELKIAQANLHEIQTVYPQRIKAKELSVEEAKADVKTQEAQLKSAEENLKLKLWLLKRKEALYKQGFAKQEEVKQLKAEVASARASLRATEEALKKAKETLKTRQADLKALKAEYASKLSSAQARLKQAKIRYSYAFIYAPISGVVSYVSTQKGETVVAGMNAPEFVTILDPKRLENWIYVDETEIGKIKKGQKVIFKVDTYPNETFHAKVMEIYPDAKVQNNVVYYIVVARQINDIEKLRPQMTTHNKIIIGVRKNVLIVPNEAVKWEDNHYIVYKIVGKKVVKVPVKVGWSDDNYTQILSGLKEGDKVAVRLKVL